MNALRNAYEIEAERIIPHPDNPRKELGDLSELTASVRANGIMQDITVMHENCLTDPPEGQKATAGDVDTGMFVVLLGHRRLAAFKEAFPEGGKVRCRIVCGLSRAEQVGMMMEENMHREDLTVPEQIESFQLMLDLGETVASVAKKTGFSETTVRRRIANADAVDGIRSCGFQLTIGDMDALAGLPEEEKMDVLKRADDSKQLKAMVEQKEREIKREAAIETIISKLEAAGVKEYEGDDWYRLKTVENIQIDKSEDFELDFDGECYFRRPDRWEYWIYVKKEPEEKQEDNAENKKKAREREIKEKLQGIGEHIEEKAGDFISGMLKGDYRTDDGSTAHLLKKIVEEEMGIWCGEVLEIAMRTEEDEEKAKGIVEKAGVKEFLLAGMYAGSDIMAVDWDGSYLEEGAERMRWFISALGEYGFPPLEEEEEQVLDGTHPLYGELDNA